MNIGDKVLVFAAGSEFATAVPLSSPGVGDSVILYNLKNETRIAVPTLSFGIGDFAFVTPNFDFAGFDFKLDFNMQLIPLLLAITWTDHDVRWLGPNDGLTYYGDDPDTKICVKVTADPRHGFIEYNFGDSFKISGETLADDGAICIGPGTSVGYEIWIMRPRWYDYGSGGTQKFYLKGSLIWSGIMLPGPNDPAAIFYHVDNWLP